MSPIQFYTKREYRVLVGTVDPDFSAIIWKLCLIDPYISNRIGDIFNQANVQRKSCLLILYKKRPFKNSEAIILYRNSVL